MAFDGVLSKAFVKQQIGIFGFLSYIPKYYEHTLISYNITLHIFI